MVDRRLIDLARGCRAAVLVRGCAACQPTSDSRRMPAAGAGWGSWCDQSENGSPSGIGRRQVPDRPPVFSHRDRSPMVIDRSTDLHMS